MGSFCLKILALSVLMLFSIEKACADILTYTERSAFDQATSSGSIATTGFNTWFASQQSVDFGGFTISSAAGVYSTTAKSEGSLAAAFQSARPGSATISFDSPINAFGIDLVDWASNATNIGIPGTTHTLTISNDTGTLNRTIATTDTPNPDQHVLFFAVIDDSSFSTLTITSTTGADTIGFDDMDYGTVAAVPEPASGLCCLLGFLVQFLCFRKRIV